MNAAAVWAALGIAYLVALAALTVLFLLYGRAKSRRDQAPGASVGAGPLVDAPGPFDLSRLDRLDGVGRSSVDWGIFDIRACRVCGCTDDEACPPFGCSWVEYDLCSEHQHSASGTSLEGKR